MYSRSDYTHKHKLAYSPFRFEWMSEQASEPVNKNAMLYCMLLHNVELKRFHSHSGEERKNQQHTFVWCGITSHRTVLLFIYPANIVYLLAFYKHNKCSRRASARAFFMCVGMSSIQFFLFLFLSFLLSLNIIRMLLYKQTNTLAYTVGAAMKIFTSIQLKPLYQIFADV